MVHTLFIWSSWPQAWWCEIQKRWMVMVLLPLICWDSQNSLSIEMPVSNRPWDYGGCSHDSPSEMWGICSSRSGRNSSRFQSWSMIQPPGSWASRQDPANGCDMVWHRFWWVFPEIGYRKNTEISGFRVESDSFWMILRSPPPGNQRMALRATLTSWKWWLDYSTRSPDQDDVSDRHCQDGWEEQGRFLDLGWWGHNKNEAAFAPQIVGPQRLSWITLLHPPQDHHISIYIYILGFNGDQWFLNFLNSFNVKNMAHHGTIDLGPSWPMARPQESVVATMASTASSVMQGPFWAPPLGSVVAALLMRKVLDVSWCSISSGMDIGSWLVVFEFWWRFMIFEWLLMDSWWCIDDFWMWCW